MMQSLHENHKTATVASHAKLKAKSETILSSFGAARTFLTFGLAFNLCLAAILFVAASFNIKKDIRYCMLQPLLILELRGLRDQGQV